MQADDAARKLTQKMQYMNVNLKVRRMETGRKVKVKV